MREQNKLLEHPLSRKKKDRLIISLIIICYVIICICAWFWLWNWAGWGSPPPPDEYYNISLVQLNQTENNDYQILINWSDSDKECPIEDALFYLLGLDRADYSNFPRSNLSDHSHHVSKINGKSIDNETSIVFQDTDEDGHLSMGDLFIIKSHEHIDNNGIPSPGIARPGFTLQLRARKTKIGEIRLK